MALQSDFLVIGSGIAGLTFALKAAPHGSVALVTKKADTDSATNYAQGGIAAVFAPEDDLESHVQDTLSAGAGLCHEEAVRLMVHEGPVLVRELLSRGVEFSRDDRGDLALGREGGHSRRRIVHASDLTGREIEKALIRAAKAEPRISVFEHHAVVDLIVPPSGANSPRCLGAYVLDIARGEVDSFAGCATLLATGGMGQAYLHTTNPAISTGDGVAMAFRAGAHIANMEFMQFHPTALYYPPGTGQSSSGQAFLISEAVRGEGGTLRLRDGTPFMERYHELRDLAPRDVVARAVDAELKKSGEPHVFLDLSSIGAERIRSRFPNIYDRCLSCGLDITREWIPVVPAAHYCCGGVVTDLEGRATLPGLYAAGETAHTGVHGANRLASNSLLEALVFASRAGETAVQDLKRNRRNLDRALAAVEAWNYVGSVFSDEAVIVSHNRDDIRRLMGDYVGIVRSTARLRRALERLEIIRKEIRDYYWKYRVTAPLIELRSLALVADLVIRSALARRESRGLHYNADFPLRDDAGWRHDTILFREPAAKGSL
jgi:L-aspartate oxidase